MTEYRLTAVEKTKDMYLIFHYGNSEPEKAPDFPSLVNMILLYYTERSEFFGREPTIKGLPEGEELVIRSLRRLVIEKMGLDNFITSLQNSPY